MHWVFGGSRDSQDDVRCPVLHSPLPSTPPTVEDFWLQRLSVSFNCTQSVGIWLSDQRVVGSSPQCVLPAGMVSPHGHNVDALEQGTEPLMVQGAWLCLPSISHLSPQCTSISPVCACLYFGPIKEMVLLYHCWDISTVTFNLHLYGKFSRDSQTNERTRKHC